MNKAIKEKIEQNQVKESVEKDLAYSKGFEKIYKSNTEDIERQQRTANNLRTIGYLMEKSVYQEEKVDWAVQGGIASGIAGTGAGIIAAASAMKKNAEIEEKNKAAREWGHQQNLSFQNMADRVSKNNIPLLSMDTIQKTYEIITSWSPDTLFSYLKFDDPTINVDQETKSITVSVSWHQQDRSICIDGAIRAKIYDIYKKCVGCAHLALPTEGTKNFKGSLSGICATPSQTTIDIIDSSTYTVELEPIDLWELGLKNLPSHKKTDGLTLEQHQKIVADYANAYNNEFQNSVLTNKGIKSEFKINLLTSLILSPILSGIWALIVMVIIPKLEFFLQIILLPVCLIVSMIPTTGMILVFLSSLKINVPYELKLVKSLSIIAHILLFALPIAVTVLGMLSY